MCSYTMTFHRASDVAVRHFEHEAELSVLSKLIADQGFLVLPDGATNSLGTMEARMTVFTPYIISIQERVAAEAATASSMGLDPTKS